MMQEGRLKYQENDKMVRVRNYADIDADADSKKNNKRHRCGTMREKKNNIGCKKEGLKIRKMINDRGNL